MPNKKQTAAIVIIPVHFLPKKLSDVFSIERTIRILSEWDVAFVCPDSLRNEIRACAFIPEHINIVSFPEKYFKSIDGYNKLLMSAEFYGNFSAYEKMLVVHSDALVLEDQLEYWCRQNWSFIGAPWFRGFDKADDKKLYAVGNGGFSLRDINDCVRVLKKYSYKNLLKIFLSSPLSFANQFWLKARRRYKLIPSYNEDYFFGVLGPRLDPDFRVPEPKIALSFAFETKPQTMFVMNGNKLPFGCHAFERYDYDFWKMHIVDLPDG